MHHRVTRACALLTVVTVAAVLIAVSGRLGNLTVPDILPATYRTHEVR